MLSESALLRRSFLRLRIGVISTSRTFSFMLKDAVKFERHKTDYTLTVHFWIFFAFPLVRPYAHVPKELIAEATLYPEFRVFSENVIIGVLLWNHLIIHIAVYLLVNGILRLQIALLRLLIDLRHCKWCIHVRLLAGLTWHVRWRAMMFLNRVAALHWALVTATRL